jgi:hypothetical protein
MQVTRHGGVECRAAHNGEHIYYAKRHYPPTEIWRFSANEDTEEFVVGPFETFGWHFTVGARGIYFVAPDESDDRDAFQLRLLRFDSKQIERLAQLDHKVQIKDPGLAVSPDGRWVLGARTILDSDLILVENFK